MDLQASVDVGCSPEDLFAYVSVLDAYPRWLSIVTSVDALDGTDGDGRPVWSVELRAKIGPLARSKRLRMVRTHLVTPGTDKGGDGRWSVRFERVETDGRSHSPWVLDAEIEKVEDLDGGGGSRLSMELHYGGTLLGPVIQRMLTDEIDEAKDRLAHLVDAR